MRYIIIATKPQTLFFDREEKQCYAFPRTLPPIISWETAMIVSGTIIVFLLPVIYLRTMNNLLVGFLSAVAALFEFGCIFRGRLREKMFFETLNSKDRAAFLRDVSLKDFKKACYKILLVTLFTIAVFGTFGYCAYWLFHTGRRVGYGELFNIFASIQLIWICLTSFQPVSCFLCYFQYRRWIKESGKRMMDEQVC